MREGRRAANHRRRPRVVALRNGRPRDGLKLLELEGVELAGRAARVDTRYPCLTATGNILPIRPLVEGVRVRPRNGQTGPRADELLLGEHGDYGDNQKGAVAALVNAVKRPQQQARGQRYGVEIGQHCPLDGGREKVGQGKYNGRRIAP